MNHTPIRPKAPTAVTADFNAITNPVIGTLSKLKRTLKNGEVKTDHILQYWENRKHISVYVPPEKVEAIERGIEQRKKLEACSRQWAQAGLHATLHPQPKDAAEKKKNTSRNSANASRAKSSKPPSKRPKG
jgi:hypothetical protein